MLMNFSRKSIINLFLSFIFYSHKPVNQNDKSEKCVI